MSPISTAVRLLLALCLCSALAVTPAIAGTVVTYAAAGETGSIIVETSTRRLYFIIGNGKAVRYPVGVGRAGLQWTGISSIEQRFTEPNWIPPAAIRLAQPDLPAVIPGGAPGNPMGAAAMTLDRFTLRLTLGIPVSWEMCFKIDAGLEASIDGRTSFD